MVWLGQEWGVRGRVIPVSSNRVRSWGGDVALKKSKFSFACFGAKNCEHDKI